jgi:choline dehydrogenase-like flavoprotein
MHAGRSVLVLESGDVRSSYPAQRLNDGDCEGEPYKGLVHTRHRQIGGTINTWNTPVRGERGAKHLPLGASDFSDWSIGWDDLAPYYPRAQEVCGLGAFEYGAEFWATASRRPFGLEGTGLTSGVYQFGTAERFTRELVGRLRRESVTLVPAVTATGLAFDTQRRRVLGVQVADATGQVRQLTAETVILAGGAIENARLLLLAGLGGSGGLEWIGRGFMEHPRDYSLALIPDSPAFFAEASFYDQHAAGYGTIVGGRLALSEDARRSLQLPNAAVSLFPRPRSTTGRGIAYRLLWAIHRAVGVAWQGGYGWSGVRRPEKAFDAFNLVLNLEQRPRPENRVELGTRRDRFGNPLPRLVLHWTDREQEDLERLRRRLGEWFRTAGLGQLVITKGHRPDLNAHHHAGTTRMAASPDEGVVDSDGRVFGVENLYLAGASVFPSAGYANPTLTIVALALRLANHLATGSGKPS